MNSSQDSLTQKFDMNRSWFYGYPKMCVKLKCIWYF